MKAIDFDPDEIRRLWHSDASMTDIVKATGMGRRTLTRKARELGLPHRQRHLASSKIDAPMPPAVLSDVDGMATNAIWTAVLNQAVRDAVWYGDGRAAFGGELYNLEWFRTKDAEIICTLAGFDHRRVSDRVDRLRAAFLASVADGRRPHNLPQLARWTK